MFASLSLDVKQELPHSCILYTKLVLELELIKLPALLSVSGLGSEGLCLLITRDE